jgi:hypothetical protein
LGAAGAGERAEASSRRPQARRWTRLAREASRRCMSGTRAKRCWSEARGVVARKQKRTGVAALEQA